MVLTCHYGNRDANVAETCNLARLKHYYPVHMCRGEVIGSILIVVVVVVDTKIA